jgi:hypothetical protein
MQNELPAQWVDRIFLRLQGIYGREFTAQFSVIDQTTGIDVGLENAKQTWGEELATFSDWPEAISYALRNLPEKAPNVIRFRELCRHGPKKINYAMLPMKPTSEEREKNKDVAKVMLKGILPSRAKDHKDWARKLLANPFYEDGRPRPMACLKIAKDALEA